MIDRTYFDEGTLQLPAIMWTDDELDTPRAIASSLRHAITALTDESERSQSISAQLNIEASIGRMKRLLEAAERGVQ